MMIIRIHKTQNPTVILLMALILGSCLLVAANGTSTRIAVVDINRIIAESSYIQKSISEISVEARDLSKRLEAKGQEYESERQKFETQKPLLNESEQQARLEKLQKLADEFDELKFFFNRELQKTQERGLGPIREKIQLLIQDMARVRGIDLVMSSSSAVYHSSNIDLTAEIVASLDK